MPRLFIYETPQYFESEEERQRELKILDASMRECGIDPKIIMLDGGAKLHEIMRDDELGLEDAPDQNE